MSVARLLAHNVARVALAMLALTGGAALMVWAFGASAHVRHRLGFRFDPPAGRAGEAVQIAATNLRLVAASLLAAVVVRRLHELRRPLDVTLAAVLALNTGALGLALGAYGSRLVEAVALHAPLELAALALASGAYMTACAGDLTVAALAAVAVVAAALVAGAAVAETYVQIGGGS